MDEKEEHQPKRHNLSGSTRYLRAAVHSCTYKPSMNYFPGKDQKNSLKNGSMVCSLNAKALHDVKGCCSCLEETCHRPPREETDRLQREKERRRSAAGHSSRTQQHIWAVIGCRAQPERERQMLPGVRVLNVHGALERWIKTEHI